MRPISHAGLRTVMMKRRIITQSDAKRATATAIDEAKERNRWSNADVGDVLGCGEGTVRNRLNGDDPAHQMSVYELARAIAAGQPEIANHILKALCGHHVAPDCADDAPQALDAAAASAQCAADLIAIAPDGISLAEAKATLPTMVRMQALFAGLEAQMRQIIGGDV